MTVSAGATDIIILPPQVGTSTSSNPTADQGYDIYDLDHYKYYFWGLKYTVPAGEQITAAKLTFYNLDDWTTEKPDPGSDRLYIDLFNSATDSGVGAKFGSAWNTYLTQFNNTGDAVAVKGDNQTKTDALGGLGGYRLGTGNGNSKFQFFGTAGTAGAGYWYDDDDPSGPRNLEIDIPSALFGWMSDGNFGVGLDPDCHYYNTKIELVITTCRVPDGGATAMLLGMVLMGMSALRRRL